MKILHTLVLSLWKRLKNNVVGQDYYPLGVISADAHLSEASVEGYVREVKSIVSLVMEVSH